MKKIVFLLSLFFTNCATANHYWSPIIEPPDKLKSVDLNDRVKLILKNKHEIEGELLERTEDRIVLQVISPDSLKGQTKFFPTSEIRGVIIEKNYESKPLLRVALIAIFGFIVVFYFTMRALGEGLS